MVEICETTYGLVLRRVTATNATVRLSTRDYRSSAYPISMRLASETINTHLKGLVLRFQAMFTTGLGKIFIVIRFTEPT